MPTDYATEATVTASRSLSDSSWLAQDRSVSASTKFYACFVNNVPTAEDVKGSIRSTRYPLGG